ncbi:MAG: AAA domain-containing protein, partial [Bacteroidota bacterium]
MNQSYVSNIIKYFRECYKADTRTFVLNNYLANKVGKRFIFEGEDEFLSGHIRQFPIGELYGQQVESELMLYQKEKELFAFSIFITGLEEGIKDAKHKVCAPLFIHPVQIIKEKGFYYAVPEFGKSFINVNFISKLIDEKEDEFYEELSAAFLPGEVDFAMMGELKRILEKYLTGFDGGELLNFPALYNEKALKKYLNLNLLKRQTGFKALPAVGLGIIKKSTQTRGVLNELAFLAQLNDGFSSTLNALLRDQWKRRKNVNNSKKSGRLNESQESIIASARRNLVTQVTGPPGTGKSFAIASLAIDFMSVGKSVLISAKTNEAVNVIADKIRHDFDLESVMIRAGKRDYKKNLKTYLKDELSAVRKIKSFAEINASVRASEKKLDTASELVERLTKAIDKQLVNEYHWSGYLAEKGHDVNWFQNLKVKYIKWRHSLGEPYWKLVEQFFEAVGKLEIAYKGYLFH